MGLWDNCVDIRDVLLGLEIAGFAELKEFHTDGYLYYGRGDLHVPVKRPNIHGKIPLISAEETYYAADLDVPDWTLVSCEI